MHAEIISIGNELLLGHIIDTNAAYLSHKLAALGIDARRRITVGDNPAHIVSALEEALSRSEIAITIGGLGPTVDDVTLCAVGSAVSRPLVPNIRQALIPKGAKWFENKVGTALAIIAKYGKRILIALPGPPRELIPIFENSIVPYLKKSGFAGKSPIKTKTRKIAGLVELEYVVGKILKKNKKSLAIAESCTGGLIASRITDVSGSSKYFKMGVVTYSNKSKTHLLGVSEKKLKKFGAVSKEVALEMASGVRLLAKSDIGLAATGMAEPAGSVYIAISAGKKKMVKRYRFIGSRKEVKHQSSTAALNLLRII